MEIRYRHGDSTVALSVEKTPGGWRVRLPDGTDRDLSARRLSDGDLELVVEKDGAQRVLRVPVTRNGTAVELAWQGRAWAFEPWEAGRETGRPPAESGALQAPMVGLVTDVLVSPGDRVAAGQPLALVEAMKVVATVAAPFAGTVATVHVHKREQVAQGAPIADITPDSEAAEGEGR